MLHLVVAVISLASMALGAPATAGIPVPTTCPGGVAVGKTTTTGRYWYTCMDGGKLTMTGCVTDMGEQLTGGKTFKSRGYLFECTPKNDEFTFTYKGCVSENDEAHMPGDTWEDKNYWYTCTKTTDSVVAEVKGCMDEGKRYNPDEKVKKTDLVYECKRFGTGNIGWNMYPNHAETVTYNPTLDHVHFAQTVPGVIKN